MKKTFILLSACALLLCACNNDPRLKLPQTGNFGQSVTEDQSVIGPEFVSEHIGQKVKVAGVIEEYCKGEGCWLTLKNNNGDAILVEVENKAFVLPHNIAGKSAVVEGNVIEKTDEQGRHDLCISAKGVLIK